MLVMEQLQQQFLLKQLLREGIKYVTAGMNPMDVKRGLR